MIRVGVVGCGLVGAAVARELQRRGASTVVFEKEPAEYHALNAAGIRAHLDLHGAGGGPQWFFPTGNLVWAADAEGRATVAARAQRLGELGYPVEPLAPAAVRDLEPDVRLGEGVDEVLFLPLEGYVLPALLLARLLGDALDLGAELRCPARVERLDETESGVVLTLDDGSTERFDVAVVCAGRWTEPLLATAGVRVPMTGADRPGSPALGFLAYTAPAPVRLGRVLTSPGLNVRPDGGGRLVLQALDLDADADPASPAPPDGPAGRELLRRLAVLLPGAAGVELESMRVGQRALPADGLTVAGPAGAAGRIYVVATHSGVTLAPLLGRLAADEVAGGELRDELAAFRPQRFDA